MAVPPFFKIVYPYMIFSLTPVHAGSGRGVGEEYVDVPIQRDSLGLPVIWGSSIKGALRTAYRAANNGKQTREEDVIFGPEGTRAGEYSSSIMILDAKLLFIPVPSLKEAYAYVTTRLMLEKAKKVFEISGINNICKTLDEIIKLCMEDRAIVSNNKLLLENKVLLKDKAFDAEYTEELRTNLEDLLDEKNIDLPIDKDDVVNRVVILPDDPGISFISRATIAVTRIKLKYKTKTVEPGALWDEEYVPEFTMFITAMLLSDPKKSTGDLETAKNIFENLSSKLNFVANKDFNLVLGGHETIGKGIVRFCRWGL